MLAVTSAIIFIANVGHWSLPVTAGLPEITEHEIVVWRTAFKVMLHFCFFPVKVGFFAVLDAKSFYIVSQRNLNFSAVRIVWLSRTMIHKNIQSLELDQRIELWIIASRKHSSSSKSKWNEIRIITIFRYHFNEKCCYVYKTVHCRMLVCNVSVQYIAQKTFWA